MSDGDDVEASLETVDWISSSEYSCQCVSRISEALGAPSSLLTSCRSASSNQLDASRVPLDDSTTISGGATVGLDLSAGVSDKDN